MKLHLSKVQWVFVMLIRSCRVSLHQTFSKVYESKLQELQKQVETRSLAAETPDEEEEEEEEDEGNVF